MAVTVAVCEIFSVKSGMTLNTGSGFVQGHWKWHHLIDRVRVHKNSPSIITLALSCIVCEIYLLVEHREIFIPHMYLAPPQGVTPSEFRKDV